MKKYIILLTLLLVIPMRADAAFKAWHVGVSATGDESGDDWSNQCTIIVAESGASRGDSIYVADGDYKSIGTITWNIAESGTDYIYVVKATDSGVHGDNGTWVSTYGDGQAIFDSWYKTTGYWKFDGVTRDETDWSDSTAYGFVVDDDDLSALRTVWDTDADHTIYQYIDISNVKSCTGISSMILYGFDNSTVTHCSLRDNGGASLYVLDSDSSTTTYNYFARNNSCQSFHGELVEFVQDRYTVGADSAVTDIIVAYNIFEDGEGTGYLMLSQGTGGTAEIYGNTFWRTANCEETVGNGIIATWSGSEFDFTDANIYNNTFYNLDAVHLMYFTDSTDNTFYNNAVYSVDIPQADILDGVSANDYNAYESAVSQSESNEQIISSDPFIDSESGDFSLADDTVLEGNGDTTKNPIGVDRDGTDWDDDIGAFGYSVSEVRTWEVPSSIAWTDVEDSVTAGDTIVSDKDSTHLMGGITVPADSITFTVSGDLSDGALMRNRKILTGWAAMGASDTVHAIDKITAYTNDATYLTARNDNNGESTINYNLTSNQRAGYYIYRFFMSFPIGDISNVSAASIVLDGSGDNSTVDDDVIIYSAQEYAGDVDADVFTQFDGWAASGQYTGNELNDTWNTGDYSDNNNTFTLNAVGIDSLEAAANDTMRVVFLGRKDDESIANVSNEYVTFSFTTPAPYLSYTSGGGDGFYLAGNGYATTVYFDGTAGSAQANAAAVNEGLEYYISSAKDSIVVADTTKVVTADDYRFAFDTDDNYNTEIYNYILADFEVAVILDSNVVVDHCTIICDTLYADYCTFTSCIFEIDNIVGSNNTITYSLFSSNGDYADPGGTGNDDGDPLFTDQAGYDFTLSAGSPAIDTGDSGTDMGAEQYGGQINFGGRSVNYINGRVVSNVNGH